MLVIKFRTLVIYILIAVFTVCTFGSFLSRDITASVNLPDDGVKLPILMYHGITDEAGKIGRYVISKKMFKEDLEYLSQMGYTTVTADEVIAYVKGEGELPQKPVMLTFDDGYYNNYCYGYPLLKEYNAKAVISIIGKYTDMYTELEEENPAYSHITWTEVTEMMESGVVEFQNHSYDLHSLDKGRRGAGKKKNEAEDEYKKMLKGDIGLLQEKMQENTGYTPTTFAYPFGNISQASYSVLDELGFVASFGCEEKVNIIKRGELSCLKCMDRFLRSDKKSARKILESID